MLAEDCGATLVEYALVIALIAVVIVSVAQSFGAALYDMYQRIASTTQSA